MSLKAFHLVFITVSVILSFGFGVWCLNVPKNPGWVFPAMGWGSIVTGLALLVYGRYFLKKLKHVSYL